MSCTFVLSSSILHYSMDQVNTGNEQDLTKIDWLPRLIVSQLPKDQCNAKKKISVKKRHHLV